jgi:hypothetical protein
MLTVVPCAAAPRPPRPPAPPGPRWPPPPRPPPAAPPRPAGGGVKLWVSRTLTLSATDFVVDELWKLRVDPGRLGNGMKRSSATAAGSIREIGIWLFANGWPVAGSTSGVPAVEKSPRRIASVGTVAY